MSWIGQKGVDNGRKVDGVSVLFQLLVDAHVILAEGAGADDGDLKGWEQWLRYLPCTAVRQRA